ncbi:MAG: hypothetical protein IBJ11_12500 [Phycisphaerales bacterium]|nr:hypothetical protein [Phycisphaerales bacterium]
MRGIRGGLNAAASGLSKLRAGLASLLNMAVPVLIVGGVAAWFFVKGPLEHKVAGLADGRPPAVRFNWPATPGTNMTWIPVSVQQHLTAIVASNIAPDPFDSRSLVAVRDYLLATGWVDDRIEIRRTHTADGPVIDIKVLWRIPAATVKTDDGREVLVGMDGAPILLQDKTPMFSRGFVIRSPRLPPPVNAAGELAYGVPWPGGDVQAALDLLRRVAAAPESKSVVGVDLAEFAAHSRLLLLTDAGTTIVWGAPPGQFTPGEVSADSKLAALREVLAPGRRLDVGRQRIEIHTPVASGISSRASLQ